MLVTKIESFIKKNNKQLDCFIHLQAEACKSVDFAFKRCPKGMFSEIKYDGERVQVHKQGDTFQYFSRSLKPVQNHKVSMIFASISKLQS